jgi:colanic acid/amylovoran biosynthesis glycosyltransferase
MSVPNSPINQVEASNISVCVVAPNLGLYSEVWLHRQIIGLCRPRVSVLTWNNEGEDVYSSEGIAVSVCPPSSHPRSLVESLIRRVQNRLRNNGWFNGDRREIAWIRRFLDEQRPDVLLVHYGTTATRLFPLFRHLDIPIVVHFHGFDLSKALRSFKYKRALKSQLRAYAGLVCVASYQQAWLLAQGAPTDRIHLIPCGTPMGDLSVACDVSRTPCRFIAVGRLVPKKGPDLTIRAFARCLESFPNVELTMIGDGPLREECESLATALGVASRIRWLGAQENSRVRSELASSCVYVQHSITAEDGDKEGWPVALAEAAGTGLPVVASRHAGIVDQVAEGITGLLVDEGDWIDMASHMIKLAADPELRRRMGDAARTQMAKWDTINQIGYLERVLVAATGKCARVSAYSVEV